jgi:hypothetical protein
MIRHRGTETTEVCNSHFLGVSVAFIVTWLSVGVSAQQLINRVMARVGGEPITLTDVQAAIGLGVIQPMGPDQIVSGTQLMIDRQLMLTEVQRFPPPEPMVAAVTQETARLRMNAGAGLANLKQSTGVDDERIHDIARDDLRILAYLDQRFGTAVQVSDEEVAAYYRDHQAEFAGRGGDPAPFEDVAGVARQRASEARRRATIDQWTRDLRGRADITVNPTGSRP